MNHDGAKEPEDNEPCQTRLLNDDPADHDFFESHSRIAKVLEETIDSSDRAQTVALIGPFGSGKSTIVHFVRQHFEHLGKQLKTAVFIFDAWAHQGDPLRRSFLESLRDYLAVHTTWLDSPPEDLNERFESMAQRKQFISSTSSPVLTRAGAIVALMFFLEPLAIVWLPKGTASSYLLLFSPVIAAILLLCIGADAPANLRFLSKPLLGEPIEDSKTLDKKLNKLKSHTLGQLFFKQTQQVTRSTTVATPDPTSIEFATIFEKLLETALADKDRRLVIVMDNLDRLDAETAFQLVSTMRIFAQSAGAVGRTDNVWLIVPFSPEWRSILFRAVARDDTGPANQRNPDAQKHASPEQTQPESSSPEALFRTFLEKNFQLKFYVNEPPLSNWQKFLTDRLAEAIPAHSEDAPIVCALYARCVATSAASLSPRSIKHYLNEVVLTHRQWELEIPFLTQCAYLLKSKETLQAWVRGSLPDAKVVSLTESAEIADSKWDEHFAGLYYNIAPLQALHAIRGPKILDALTNAKHEQLTALAKDDAGKSACVWELTRNSASFISAPHSLAIAADALARAELLNGNIAQRMKLMFDAVVTPLNLVDERVGSGLVSMLDLYQETTREALLRKTLSTIPPPAVELGVDPGAAVTTWVKAMTPLLRYARDQKYDLTNAVMPTGQDVNQYLALLQEAVKQAGADDLGAFNSFVPQSDRGEVLDAIGARYDNPTTTGEALALLQALPHLLGPWPYERVLPALEKVINDPDIDADRARSAISGMRLLSFDLKAHGAQDKAIALITSGTLLNASWKVAEPELRASALFWYLLSQTPRPAFHNAEAMADEFMRVIQSPNQEEYGPLIRDLTTLTIQTGLKATLPQWDSHAALKDAVLREALQRVDFETSKLGLSFADDYEFFASLDPETFSKTALVSAKNRTIRKALLAQQFDHSKIPLYVVLLSAEYSKREAAEFVRKGLQSIGADEWLEQIKKHGELITLALAANNTNGFLGPEFQKALVADAKDLLTTANPGSDNDPKRSEMIALLDDDHRKIVPGEVEREAINHGEMTEAFVNRYGDLLTKADSLLEQRPQIVVQHLLRPLAAAKAPWAARELLALCKARIEVIREASAAVQVSLIENISEAKKDCGDYTPVEDFLRSAGIWKDEEDSQAGGEDSQPSKEEPNGGN